MTNTANRYDSKYTGKQIDQAIDNSVVFVDELPNPSDPSFIEPDENKIYIVSKNDHYDLLYHFSKEIGAWKQLGALSSVSTEGDYLVVNDPHMADGSHAVAQNIKLNGTWYNVISADVADSDFTSNMKESAQLRLE